jgi:type II secretory ATPase GspE/PulE/Tfp pilus assembly ATPase PilB-like protein
MISQRLIPVLCPGCKIPLYQGIRLLQPWDKERALAAAGEYFSQVYLTNTAGCELCRKGTIGRTVAAEVIAPDEDLMALLRKEQRREAAEYSSKILQNLTMREHAAQKVFAGLTDPLKAESFVGPLGG